MTMNKLFDDVREFHLAFNHPAPFKPVLLDASRVGKRADWMREEVDELVQAKTVVDQADACIDIIYFAIGTLVELGVKPEGLWNIVQAANMAKLGPDGKPLYHPDGKTKKPEGWEAPEPKLAAEIERQIKEAE